MAKKKITAMPETVTIEVNDRVKTVRTEDYIRAKTKALREFGYTKLGEDVVRRMAPYRRRLLGWPEIRSQND